MAELCLLKVIDIQCEHASVSAASVVDSVTVSLEIVNSTSDVDYVKLYACGSAAEGYR